MEALSLLQLVLGGLSGVLVGFVLGVVGGGGSILAVPLMLYVVGVGDPHVAIGTSALAVAVNAVSNLVIHARRGNVRWPCASVFALAGIAGAGFTVPDGVIAAPADVGEAAFRAVDPFIGTGGEGHTFPGATVPYGMIQLSPDTRIQPRKDGYGWAAGYRYDDTTIVGFSHTHFSGTGHSDLGDLLLMPTTGEPKLERGDPDQPRSGYTSRFRHATETAQPGYYAVTLDDHQVRAELTASEVGRVKAGTRAEITTAAGLRLAGTFEPYRLQIVQRRHAGMGMVEVHAMCDQGAQQTEVGQHGRQSRPERLAQAGDQPGLRRRIRRGCQQPAALPFEMIGRAISSCSLASTR